MNIYAETDEVFEDFLAQYESGYPDGEKDFLSGMPNRFKNSTSSYGIGYSCGWYDAKVIQDRESQ